MGGILTYPVSSHLLQRKGNAYVRVGSSEMQGYRKDMEDSHNSELQLPNHPRIGLFGIYDGHGGAAASAFLEKRLPGAVNRLKDPLNAEALVESVVELDKEFLQNVEFRDHGSACVFALVQYPTEAKDSKYTVLVNNIGDSRALILRKNGSYEPLSSDHKPSVPTESERIHAAGGRVNLDRVDGALALSRAFGDSQYKDNPNLPYHAQKVIACGDTMSVEAEVGDTLLVFCDGLVEQMTNDVLIGHVKTFTAKYPDDPAKIAQYVIKASLTAGSKDNHSMMVIQFTDGIAYGRADQFIAGTFKPYERDTDFVRAYLEDAERHGYKGGELMRMALNAEADVLPQDDAGPGLDAASLSQLINMARMQGLQFTGDHGNIGVSPDDDEVPST